MHLVAGVPFNLAHFFTQKMYAASLDHVRSFPYAPFIMSFILKYTKIAFECEVRHDRYVPEADPVQLQS